MAQGLAYTQRTISGTVESVNPKGVKVNGEWANFSKFAADITPPERGQFVTLTLDKSGFVREIEAAGGGSEPLGRQPQPAGQKDRTITRLAVLKAAAEFAASRPNATSADVLKVAASWEAWVLREDELLDESPYG